MYFFKKIPRQNQIFKKNKNMYFLKEFQDKIKRIIL